MSILAAIFGFVRAILRCRARLALENLALRHQLAVLRRSVKRPRLRPQDRIFWVLLRRFWGDWRSHLILVNPETVVRWHRRGFRLFWRWKSRSRGRPKIRREVIDLIRRMSRENPTWGVAQIEIRAPPLEQDSQVNPELAGRAGLITRMTSSRRKLDPTRVPSVSEHTTLGAQRSYTATLLPDRSSPSRQSPQMGAGQFLLANT